MGNIGKSEGNALRMPYEYPSTSRFLMVGYRSRDIPAGKGVDRYCSGGASGLGLSLWSIRKGSWMPSAVLWERREPAATRTYYLVFNFQETSEFPYVPYDLLTK